MTNQRISTEAVLKGGVRKDSAWKIISDFGNYPSLVRSVEKVIVHQRGENEGRSEWFVSVEDAPLRWMEKDFFDHPHFGITFESVDGDFEQINGAWKVEDFNSEGIKLDFSLDYDLGIPVIEEVVGPVLREKMKNNIDSMMRSIAGKLTESFLVEERREPRISVGVFNTLYVNGKETRLRVVNISKRGMMFVSGPASDSLEALFIIDGVVVNADLRSIDGCPGKTRAVFQRELRQDELDHVLQYLTTKNVRSHERKTIDSICLVKSGDKTIAVHIADISRGGMLVRGPVEGLEGAIELAGVALSIRRTNGDPANAALRIQFEQPINETVYSDMVSTLKRIHPRSMQMQIA